MLVARNLGSSQQGKEDDHSLQMKIWNVWHLYVWNLSGRRLVWTDKNRQTDTSDKSSSGDVRLIEALNSEIIHLKTMLSEERDDHRKEKAEVIKERENYQKILMFLHQDNQHLRQQLLEAPKHSKFDVDSAADGVHSEEYQ